MDRIFPLSLWPSAKRVGVGHENKEGKNEDP